MLNNFETAEPGAADLRVVLPKGKIFRLLNTVDVREVEVEMFVERDTDRFKALHTSKV